MFGQFDDTSPAYLESVPHLYALDTPEDLLQYMWESGAFGSEVQNKPFDLAEAEQRLELGIQINLRVYLRDVYRDIDLVNLPDEIRSQVAILNALNLTPADLQNLDTSLSETLGGLEGTARAFRDLYAYGFENLPDALRNSGAADSFQLGYIESYLNLLALASGEGPAFDPQFTPDQITRDFAFWAMGTDAIGDFASIYNTVESRLIQDATRLIFEAQGLDSEGLSREQIEQLLWNFLGENHSTEDVVNLVHDIALSYTGTTSDELLTQQANQLLGFAEDYLIAAQIDDIRRMVREWDSETERDLMEQLQAEIQRMPDTLLDVPVDHIRDDFQAFLDFMQKRHEWLENQRQQIDEYEAYYGVLREETERMQNVPLYAGLAVGSILFEPIDWLDSALGLMQGDLLSAAGFLPLIPGSISRMSRLLARGGYDALSKLSPVMRRTLDANTLSRVDEIAIHFYLLSRGNVPLQVGLGDELFDLVADARTHLPSEFRIKPHGTLRHNIAVAVFESPNGAKFYFWGVSGKSDTNARFINAFSSNFPDEVASGEYRTARYFDVNELAAGDQVKRPPEFIRNANEDSEPKVLEELYRHFQQNPADRPKEITLYTERIPCESCGGEIDLPSGGDPFLPGTDGVIAEYRRLLEEMGIELNIQYNTRSQRYE